MTHMIIFSWMILRYNYKQFIWMTIIRITFSFLKNFFPGHKINISVDLFSDIIKYLPMMHTSPCCFSFREQNLGSYFRINGVPLSLGVPFCLTYTHPTMHLVIHINFFPPFFIQPTMHSSFIELSIHPFIHQLITELLICARLTMLERHTFNLIITYWDKYNKQVA